MAFILAGTAYNQAILFKPDDKRKKKEVYGALSRHPILHLSYYSPRYFGVFASSKSLTSVFKGETSEIVRLSGKQTIISADISDRSDKLEYTLSNAGIYQITVTDVIRKRFEFQTVYKGESHNFYVGARQSLDNQKTMFFGKGVVPQIVDKNHSVVAWKGKNVKHDELDLEVPINDVDGGFWKENSSLAILNGNNKLRIYDVRGTHKRPVSDIELQAAPRSSMTKLCFTECRTGCYVGNSVGEIFLLDSRKNWTSAAKYKGITTSITGLREGQSQLYASSMDCYVRIFDCQERSIVNKFYLGKPIYSLDVDFYNCSQQQQQKEDYEEEEVDLSEEQEGKKKKKVKHIRKRNKVGLKYLRPREFDTPEEEQIKEEEEAVKKEQWYADLNPIDRRQFQEE